MRRNRGAQETHILDGRAARAEARRGFHKVGAGALREFAPELLLLVVEQTRLEDDLDERFRVDSLRRVNHPVDLVANEVFSAVAQRADRKDHIQLERAAFRGLLRAGDLRGGGFPAKRKSDDDRGKDLVAAQGFHRLVEPAGKDDHRFDPMRDPETTSRTHLGAGRFRP